jgi:TolB-like protein/tetratricopeptide (TPR) repeat protein
MKLLAELRRRNVIRMAGLYLVGAWLVIQVTGTVLPMFDAPAWLPRSIVVLLAIGFVPALVFSWLYELTPEGLKRDAEVTPEQSIAAQTGRRMDRLLAVGLVAVVALVAADRFWPRGAEPGSAEPGPEHSSGPDGPATPTGSMPEPYSDPGSPSPAGQKSIAVLPFVNMSADKDNEYFSDGISEELLNVLVRVDGIGVASRTSSFAYKGRELGTAAIAKELKVDHILEGSVRKAGNRVRITAQLIDAASDRHLWSETYDRELIDIFAIQAEIANAIVKALRGTLGTTDAPAAVTVRADTGNIAAYDLYLKARELFIARTELAESVRLFERVVALDPEFARGWEGLAAVASVVESWGIRDRDYTAMSKAAAERALALDSSLSMPWAALGNLRRYGDTMDWAENLALFDRAVAADAKNTSAYLWRGIAWISLGFFERAIADFDRCLALDPAYQNCKRHKALALLFKGDTAQALAAFEEGVAAGFETNRAESFVPALWANGDRLAAALLVNRFTTRREFRQVLLAALAGPDKLPPDAEAIVTRYFAEKPELSLQTIGAAHSYLWIGAFDRVPDAIDRFNNEISGWERSPRGFRNSPGFKRTLELDSIPVYWRAHGFPPQCRPVGDTDFECDPVP